MVAVRSTIMAPSNWVLPTMSNPVGMTSITPLQLGSRTGIKVVSHSPLPTVIGL